MVTAIAVVTTALEVAGAGATSAEATGVAVGVVAVVRVAVVESMPRAAPPEVIVRADGVIAVLNIVVAAAESASETQTVKSTTTEPCEASSGMGVSQSSAPGHERMCKASCSPPQTVELMTTSAASTVIAATMADLNSVSKAVGAADLAAMAVMSIAYLT